MPVETENYIRRCRKGEIKAKLILFDKEDYILRHRQRNTLGWLKEDKCTLWEVEYLDKEGNETGKLSGKLRFEKNTVFYFYRISRHKKAVFRIIQSFIFTVF